MELKPGYKRTEVGIIPEGWNVDCVKNIATVRTGPFGSSLHERDYILDGTPIITVEHLSEKGVVHSNLPMVSETDRKRLQAYSLETNDIVFSRVGSVDRNSLINPTEAGWLFSGRLLRIRPNSKRVLSAFLSYYFHDEPFKRRVRSVAVGQTMPSLNTQIINELNVALPPLPEQRAIAAALSDADALLSSLDRLLAKKRDIKQAVVQQLLTGKQRLPGFRGEWKSAKIGRLFQFLSTGNNPRSDLSVFGDVGYVHYGDIHTNEAAFLDCANAVLPQIAYKKVGNLPLLQDGDLVMADASEDYAGVGKSVEIKNVGNRKIVAGLHTFLLRGDKDLITDGYKGYLQSLLPVKAAMTRYATGISVYGISKTNIRSIEIPLPSIEEQTAIVAVLFDMDAEIDALQQRRDKTRAVKQGMMQELLTGRTRLV